ncbi:MAG: hypothetical protein LE178_01060 [Endomicrobium sp.]|nr:hypothetical protein [Endomicrobium sp.]
MFGQTIFAALLATYLSFFPSNPDFATLVNVPFLKSFFINFSFLYIVFAIIIVVGSSNAVNLTDGLDGLAIGNIIIVTFTLALFAYFSGHFQIANYLKIIPVSGAGEISVFLFAKSRFLTTREQKEEYLRWRLYIIILNCLDYLKQRLP